MDLDPSPTSRKRRLPSGLTNNNANESDEDEITERRTHTSNPSKRLQGHHGNPIPRQTYHLNTHLILNSLSLSRLRVTANFSLYNPHTSPVLICATRQNDSLYKTLCQTLPSLYPLSPNLQVLCIMPADQTSTSYWAEYQRVIPIFTTNDLDEEAADEVRNFLNDIDVETTPDSVALFDAKGMSLWSSGEMGLEGDGVSVVHRELNRALRGPRSSEEGEAMDLG